MKLRLIFIGMAAGLLLPLAAANAGAVFDPGLNQVGAGIDLARGAAPIADNYWRTVDKDKDDKGDHDKGDHDRDCDKSPSKDRDCNDHDKDDKHHDKDHDKDHKGDKDDKGDKDHKDK